MAYTVPTLEDLVRAHMEADGSGKLPRNVESRLQYCSKKLYDARVKTEEEFDDVLAQYSDLDRRLKAAAGLRLDVFRDMITELKETYYR